MTAEHDEVGEGEDKDKDKAPSLLSCAEDQGE